MIENDNILCGSVYVYDYEHSGDSRMAYDILSRFGVKVGQFFNNGDGNTAEIWFSMPYDQTKVRSLATALNNAGYGYGFSNLWQFESQFKMPDLNPRISVDELWELYQEGAGYYELLEGDLERAGGKIVLVEYKNYISTLTREPARLEEAIHILRDELKCSQWYVSRNDMELEIVGVTTIADCRRAINKESLPHISKMLFQFCNRNATRYGEYRYGLAYWKRDYPQLMKRLFNIN